MATLPLTAPGCARDKAEEGLFHRQAEEGFVGNSLHIGALQCQLQRSSPKPSVGCPDQGQICQVNWRWQLSGSLRHDAGRARMVCVSVLVCTHTPTSV